MAQYKDSSDAKEMVRGSPVAREKFSSKFQYLMTSISYSVGLGNIWRFPYLCYKNGGGSFLLPFFTSLLFIGLVFFFFESVMGQYTGFGPMKLWKIAPVMGGIAFASMIMCCFLSIYYNMLIAWAIYFFYESFQTTVPWSVCHTDDCFLLEESSQNLSMSMNISLSKLMASKGKTLTPSADFFFNVVLQITDDVRNFDGFRSHLVFSLAAAWITVFLCLCFGAKILGRISTFTTFFPYLMLSALLIRSVQLDGAYDGLVHYLKPDFSMLTHSRVWADAGSQIFYAMSICMGGVVTLASYNQFHNNTLRDSIIIIAVNSFTSVYAGFAIFSVIGYLAKQLNVPVDQAVDGGVGLAFIAYPAALALMPASNVWSAVFFFMIILLGFGSQFTLVETVVSNIVDFWPNQLRRYKPAVLGATCFTFFLCALPMCTGAGYYILQLVDAYAANYSVFVLGVCEAIGFAWFYGVDRILDHFYTMAGFQVRPRWLWKVLISYICPSLILTILVLTLYNFESLTTAVKGNLYSYPFEIECFGFAATMASIIMVPIFAVRQCIFVFQGKKRWSEIFRTTIDYNNNPEGYPKC